MSTAKGKISPHKKTAKKTAPKRRGRKPTPRVLATNALTPAEVREVLRQCRATGVTIAAFVGEALRQRIDRLTAFVPVTAAHAAKFPAGTTLGPMHHADKPHDIREPVFFTTAVWADVTCVACLVTRDITTTPPVYQNGAVAPEQP